MDKAILENIDIDKDNPENIDMDILENINIAPTVFVAI